MVEKRTQAALVLTSVSIQSSRLLGLSSALGRVSYFDAQAGMDRIKSLRVLRFIQPHQLGLVGKTQPPSISMAYSQWALGDSKEKN